MRKAITIVQPPLRVSRDFIDYPYHSDLGVVQVASVLRDNGAFSVSIVDSFAMENSDLSSLDDGYVLLGAPVQDVVREINNPDIILVHYTPFHRPPARDAVLASLLESIRGQHSETPIILADMYQSGEHYVEAPGDKILAAYPEADALLKYQAESSIAQLCKELVESGRLQTPRSLSGVAVADMDDLPSPMWEEINLDARDQFMSRVVQKLGRGGWAFPIDGRTLPAITSRGCPYRCGHCSSNPSRQAKEPKVQRRHTAQVLADRITTLVKAHGATRVNVLDEMVNVDTDHFDGLLKTFTELDVKYDFPNGMRADWVTKNQLAQMAGRISTLSVSAESGTQRVVDSVVDKKLKLTAIENTLKNADEVGIASMVHFIIGMPGETRQEINQTLEYAIRLYEEYGAWPAVQFATPLPGTRLAENTAKSAVQELPVVDDYSPLFQHHPVTSSNDFTPDDLRQFMWTFEQRLMAGRNPHKVIMNVTYKCNNRCNFCAVGTRSQQDGNYDFQKKVLARFRKQGLRMVDFDGGEPTMYDKLVPLVRYCRQIGYTNINVTSNGRMCVYPEYAEKLVNSGLTTLLFSVHGPDKETHARNVGVLEAFDQTVDGIKNCVKYQPEDVDLGMNITLTKSNYNDLPAVTQLAWDLGLRWLNIQFLTPFGRATQRVNPDTAAAAKVAMKTIDEWRDRMKFQVINLPFCFMPGYEEFILGDLLKIQRHMVFVNNEDVNLYDYLRERRNYTSECHSCAHRVFCGGFYELDDSPEPPWEFTILDPDDMPSPVTG